MDHRLLTRTSYSLAAASIIATLSLAACNRTAQPQAANEPRSVGQQIDTAIDRTQQKIAEVGDKAADKLSEAGKKTEAAVAGAADKLSARTREVTSTTTGTDTTTTTTTTTTTPSFNTADASRAVSDAAITASVKTDFLKDPDLSVLKIDVDTKGGVVTLNGLASDESARSRAEKMAGSIKGVKEVRNFLVVKRA